MQAALAGMPVSRANELHHGRFEVEWQPCSRFPAPAGEVAPEYTLYCLEDIGAGFISREDYGECCCDGTCCCSEGAFKLVNYDGDDTAVLTPDPMKSGLLRAYVALTGDGADKCFRRSGGGGPARSQMFCYAERGEPTLSLPTLWDRDYHRTWHEVVLCGYVHVRMKNTLSFTFAVVKAREEDSPRG